MNNFNILYFHNGNFAVKQWARDTYSTHREMPCFTEEWDIGDKKISLFEDKFEFLKTNHNILFDLSAADRLSTTTLAKLSTCCKVIKICTSYYNDLDNLEDIWSLYDYNQWVIASMLNLWATDQIIFFKESMDLLGATTQSPIVFTPGRCGTHVLLNVLKLSTFMHHNLENNHANIGRLINAEKIFSVLRKNFINQVASDAISNKIKLVVSNKNNLNQHKEIFKNKEISITDQDIADSFDKLARYVDILVALKIFWKKEINFCYYEDLSSYFNSITVVKNPYDNKTIITNYNEVEEKILKNYQLLYQKMLNRIEQTIGLSIY